VEARPVFVLSTAYSMPSDIRCNTPCLAFYTTVDADMIAVSGMEPANPIAANDSPEGRQLNRLVEIVVQRKNASSRR
jgi:hypothetical protein